MFRLDNIFIKRITSLYLSLFLLILFSGIELMHHHSDTHEDKSCMACSLTNTLSNTFINISDVPKIIDSFEIFVSAIIQIIISLKPQQLQTDRAPPF